eukprot:TRINITY_DN15145_c0_g1_i1.p1 TRINITY_DN15145_c0_g1~~TRINITY_DN15145_c0_g1_i1.p1  ORF type:complete len:120 (-),score=38.01 TRINITY_DN15145_c0_g1_i1:265-600(-)
MGTYSVNSRLGRDAILFGKSIFVCQGVFRQFVSFLDLKFDKMANMKRGGEYDNGMGGPKRSKAYTDKFEMGILVPARWLALSLEKVVRTSRRSGLTSRLRSGSLTVQDQRG